MARVNVYLPDGLAERARASKLNVSALTRAAVEAALKADVMSAWLARAAQLPPTGVTHEDVIAAPDAARAEMGETAR